MEHEFLNALKKAVSTYEKGLKLAEAHLGAEHGISETLRNSLREARSAAESKAGRGGRQRGGGHGK